MLTDIEEKVVERIEAKITEPKRVEIQGGHRALSIPEIDVIVSGGSFEKVAQNYKLKATVNVMVTFQNLQSIKERRKGVYPILLAILACLIGQKLGLAIDPLVPRRLDNTTEEKEAKAGQIVFQLEFETSFIIDKLSDEEIEDLLSIGLNYYLIPDDEVADATDVVIVQESPGI